jgi:hypothetical protein
MKRILFLLFAAMIPLYGEAAAWSSRILEGFSMMEELKGVSEEAIASSGLFLKGSKAIPISADVSGLKWIWLKSGVGGDGSGGDHSCWLNPKLVGTDGKEIDATTVGVAWNSIEWQKLFVNKALGGGAFNIGGDRYTSGWWAHAVGYLGIRLDGKYVKFSSLVGNNGNAHASKYSDFFIYRTLPRKTLEGIVAETLATEFTQMETWLQADFDKTQGGHLALLETGAEMPRKLRELINSHANRLGVAKAPFVTRLGAIADDANQLAKLLDLYRDVREATSIVEQADEALAFAKKTLEFVELSRKLPELSATLDKLYAQAKEIPNREDGSWNALLADAKALRRQIIFAHPALGFKDLLINKQPPTRYSHQCDQYLAMHSRPGPGLVILKNWKSPKPQEVTLLEGKLPLGSVAHPDLSFDGKRILFSYCDHTVTPNSHRQFFTWEIGIDGNGLRQLTGGKDDDFATWDGRKTVLPEDYDPCYLPNGQIVFISTRCSSFGRCHWTRYNPSYLLHIMDGDGKNKRLLSFGEANEWDPSVLPDGRIIYTRWDYINRHDTFYQSLWTMRPDGTGTAHFYGNYTINPCMQAEARGIPDSRKVICTATAHHSYTAGSIIHIDPMKGEDGPEPLTRITPEVRFPETEGWPQTCYNSPWPLNEDLTLAAYCPEPLTIQGRIQSANAYGIVLIDSLGGREEIYSDPNVSCVSPIPLCPREKPPVVASLITDEAIKEMRPATVFIQDANIGKVDFGSRVKSMRLNEILGQPTPAVPHRGAVRQEIVKRVLGTVPVRDDGSAFFRMPAGKPIQLQALDEDGLAVMTMRTFIYAQPGELVSCIGCHEERRRTAARAGKLPTHIDSIKPLEDQEKYEGGFSYMRSVQPVLDRYCISCHGLGQATQKLDLRGTIVARPIDGYPEYPRETAVATSYNEMANRKDLFRLAQRNEETGRSIPRDYFGHSGTLAKRLLDGHCRELLADKTSLELIFTWLDLNVQYFGDYSWTRRENDPINPDGEAALRSWIKARFGEELSKQPYACLVNPAFPEKSRILNAALPIAAGGWGQITQNGFTGKEDLAWHELARLVEASISRRPAPPRDKTCGLKKCICGSCWVKNVARK